MFEPKTMEHRKRCSGQGLICRQEFVGRARPRSLLDVARARADLMARGLSPELEDVYSIAAAPRTV